MSKIKLPVILLKGNILLPSNELKLEFDKDMSEIINLSETQYNKKVLVVSQENPLEETPNIEELSTVGVIATIKSNLSLPNGKTRIVLKGNKRTIIYSYTPLTKNFIEAITTTLPRKTGEEEISNILIKKLQKELIEYIKVVPHSSNSLITQISDIKSLDKLTDIIASNINVSLSRLFNYLNCCNPIKRTEMILEDIYKDEELFTIEKKLDQKIKKEMDNSQREYLLREKIKAIEEELGDVSLKDEEINNLRIRLNSLSVNSKIKEKIEFEINRYSSLTSTSPEISIVRNYIDWLLNLPWNYETEDLADLEMVRKRLDESHYGLDSVKNRIIEYLAVKNMSHKLNGPIICLVGPPGVGKTTLAFSIAKSMNRNFVKISVGGINDESEIIGHRKSYLGAGPGRIIEGMQKAGSSNPVFLIDEIDKMNNGLNGDPASALLEVLDPEQNYLFRDNYLEVEYDLSKVMFILTANNVDEIPEALRDRLEIVNLTGYTEYEKVDIASKYLIPIICANHGLDTLDISNEQIVDIIRHYTKEAGVRELERQISSIVRKIVTSMVISNNNPNIINIDSVESYLGRRKFNTSLFNNKNQVGIVNALAYTPYGGEILPIEVNYYKGKGNLILTGLLGDVMKESATIALSYIKANYKYFNIDYDVLIENDIHIHVPDCSISKDGPSAGVTLITALISAFTDISINSNIAMTGEITLRGNILPIGGLKEKCIGAIRNRVKEIFIPYDNLSDIEDFPNEITDKLTFIPVHDYKEIYNKLINN